MNQIKIINFSLKDSIECGQFFLYEKDENNFYTIINGNLNFKIKQEKNNLLFEGINEEDLIYFFSLDEDLEELTKDFKEDKNLEIALKKYFGLRIIRQDLFQCIISFVCSAASNIPKIQNNLKLICKKFSRGKTFPKIGEINDEKKLLECRVGYRAKYILEINKILKENPNFLEEIKKADYKIAKKLLQTFPGIGPKVADCICLFSLNHKEAFPIDTWVIQIINNLYLEKNKQTKNIKKIEEFIQNYFKENKGLKQQYLFHYARNNLKK